MKYKGEKSFTGKSGAFEIIQSGLGDATIKIYLKSAPSYEEDEFGEYQEKSLLERATADISIGISYDEVDEVWVPNNLNVETLGWAGVNEFLLAFFEHQDQLSVVEDVLEVLKDLLSQSEVVWGIDYF
ncbi:hypothetical protein [Dendrosporobacter sp. 1207_IL3150]|uniref:hypothetical protein n=1 Tax=Dendrosporobacter sp. 1207_IL3150 TaxID=3084054 RepID=UPI002FD9027B